MEIIRYAVGSTVHIGVRDDGRVRQLPTDSLAALLRLPLSDFQALVSEGGPVETGEIRLLPPVDGLTEVWAAGVTYERSSQARQEESAVADVYARVYDAERPELFVKAPAWRVCGDGEPVGVRADSAVNVPEPELALVVNAGGEIVGLTICDDVSSRSIEGENPLYLPQAKVYSGACALGPGIRPIWELDPADLAITAAVHRSGRTVWGAATSTARMHRGFADLVEHLGRAATFPDGVILSTGTGLVPELDFDLTAGDVVEIAIAGIGTLRNPVRSAADFGWLTPEPARSPR
jgi:2-dehydro-3-deoxy-D-arabinonate dehydratase